MELQEFSYKAVTGGGKVSTGRIMGASEREAAIKLQKQGLTPLTISAESAGSAESPSRKRAGRKVKFSKGRGSLLQTSFSADMLPWSRPSRKDLIMFAEDLAVLLEAGISLNRSLAILSELTEKKRFSEVISDVHDRIRGGRAMWEALQAHPKVFPPVFVNMVKAGEAGGVLDAVLTKLADYLNGVQELKEYLVSAMIYPIILTLTAGGSIAILLTFVVPKFASIFSDMGVALPMATRILLGLGEFLQQTWWMILLLIAAMAMGFRYALSTPAGQRIWGRFKLRLPILGNIFRKIEISRFSRTLGTLLASGVSILSAMNIVRDVVMNRILYDHLEEVYQDLKRGKLLSQALGKSGFFPTLALHMVGVGEETGNLDTMLDKVANVYDKELKVAIKSFTAMFEPLIILLMGGLIGAMVISMLMAIFSVNDLAV